MCLTKVVYSSGQIKLPTLCNLYNICKQYAFAGVRILLQPFGLPMKFGKIENLRQKYKIRFEGRARFKQLEGFDWLSKFHQPISARYLCLLENRWL